MVLPKEVVLPCVCLAIVALVIGLVVKRLQINGENLVWLTSVSEVHVVVDAFNLLVGFFYELNVHLSTVILGQLLFFTAGAGLNLGGDVLVRS